MTDNTPHQVRIMELIRRHGLMSVEALSREMGVELDTIRREVDELFKQGGIERYFGATALPSSVENLAYRTRQRMQREEKTRIAAELARHIPDRASLFVNLGTTTEEVANALMQHKGLRVVTNNLNVATTMSGNPDFEVIVAGGIVRSRDRGVVGEATIDLIRQFRVDYAILGISAIDPDTGALLDFDYREVRVAQAIVEQSRKVFLVADHSKIGRNAMARLGHMSQIDEWFTDQEPPAQLRELLAAAGATIHVCSQ